MAFLTDENRAALARLARASAQAAVEGRVFDPAPPPDPALSATGGGCFVTLKTGGRLRGCLGCFTSPAPLWKTVVDYARHSVLEDPRFEDNRLRPDEWNRVEIEVSVLSPLAPCDDPEAIELGVHGIYVRSGIRSGCFLPQVATETGWSVSEFWSHCCYDKAGLPPDAWRTKTAQCFTFTADVFPAGENRN